MEFKKSKQTRKSKFEPEPILWLFLKKNHRDLYKSLNYVHRLLKIHTFINKLSTDMITLIDVRLGRFRWAYLR